MIKAVIIDDEPDCRTSLSYDIKQYCPDISLIGQADGVNSGIELIRSVTPDLVFLDVQMGDGTGFDLLDQFYHKNKFSLTNANKFKVIFTTAYDQFAIKAIKFSALDYLLKPILAEELITAVEKFRIDTYQLQLLESINVLTENQKSQNKLFNKIALNTGDSLDIHNIGDIIRCESQSNYTMFYLKNKKSLLVSKTLKEFDDMLSGQGFYRIHNSHLINLAYITKVIKSEGGTVTMEDGSHVPISRNKKDEFFKLISR